MPGKAWKGRGQVIRAEWAGMRALKALWAGKRGLDLAPVHRDTEIFKLGNRVIRFGIF